MSSQSLTYRCPYCGAEQSVSVNGDGVIVQCENADCRRPFHADIPKGAPIVTESELPPEDEVHRIKLDLPRRYPLQAAIGAAMLIGGAVALIAGLTRGPGIWVFIGLAMLGYAGFRVMRAILKSRGATMRITNRRVILESGAFSVQHAEVPLAQIQELLVYQTPVNRLLNVGDIAIVWGQESDPRKLLVMAAPDPEALADSIRKLIPPREPASAAPPSAPAEAMAATT